MQTEDQKKACEKIVKDYTDRVIAAFEDNPVVKDMSRLYEMLEDARPGDPYAHVNVSLTDWDIRLLQNALADHRLRTIKALRLCAEGKQNEKL